jgi:hypothetical protein
MAELKGSVIGQLRGRLGDLACRIIDGRTILAQRPVSFHVSYVPALVEIRKKFAVTGAFCKNLITLSNLYSIWKSIKEDGMSVFNYVFKKNFSESSVDKPTVDNIVTPPGGFALPVTLAAVAADNVNVQLAALNTVAVFDDMIERDLVLTGLICYYNPSDTEDAPYALTTLVSASQSLDDVNPLTFDIPLNVVQQAMAAKYQHSILYLALVTLDVDGEFVQYSSSFSQDN